MRVLILHQHFKEPRGGGAIRSWYLAKALVDHGHQAIVITGSDEKKYTVRLVDGIEVHCLPIAYENSFGFYDRSTSFIRYIVSAINVSKKIKDIDLCYAISVPLTIGIAARWLKFTRGIPYYFEVGDLWPDAPVQMGFVTSTLLRKSLERLEQTTYQEAAAVVALSPAIRDAVMERARGKKVYMIPNMADCDFYRPVSNDQPHLVVSYIGAVGLANGLDYFIESANNCRRANLPVRFVLCGDGALVDRLKGNIKQLGLTNITVTGFVNREGVRDLMNKTDVVFVSYKNLPVLQTGSPNKFFDGLAAGKMIVVNFGGWLREEIEVAKCGIYVDPNDPTDFKRKLEPFINDRRLLTSYQLAARTLAESKFSRVSLTKQWVEFIEEASNRKPKS